MSITLYKTLFLYQGQIVIASRARQSIFCNVRVYKMVIYIRKLRVIKVFSSKWRKIYRNIPEGGLYEA